MAAEQVNFSIVENSKGVPSIAEIAHFSIAHSIRSRNGDNVTVPIAHQCHFGCGKKSIPVAGGIFRNLTSNQEYLVVDINRNSDYNHLVTLNAIDPTSDIIIMTEDILLYVGRERQQDISNERKNI